MHVSQTTLVSTAHTFAKEFPSAILTHSLSILPISFNSHLYVMFFLTTFIKGPLMDTNPTNFLPVQKYIQASNNQMGIDV